MPAQSPTFRFQDRTEAGKVLAQRLASQYADRDDVIVLALPRGGVPVAIEVAQLLHAPLDVFLVRKLGLPGHEELAMGAIAQRLGPASDRSQIDRAQIGRSQVDRPQTDRSQTDRSPDRSQADRPQIVRVINDDVVRSLDLPAETIDEVSEVEAAELQRRLRQYRGDRPPPVVRDKTVILIDDGLATGSTMRAAATALRMQGPRRIVIAVPVSAASTCRELRSLVDELICAATPEPFYAVGQWYEQFEQITDEQVRELLDRAAAHRQAAPGAGESSDQSETGGAQPHR